MLFALLFTLARIASTDNTLRATLTHRDLYLGRPCPISDYYDVCGRNGENRLISRREKYFEPHTYTE